MVGFSRSSVLLYFQHSENYFSFFMFSIEQGERNVESRLFVLFILFPLKGKRNAKFGLKFGVTLFSTE